MLDVVPSVTDTPCLCVKNQMQLMFLLISSLLSRGISLRLVEGQAVVI